MILLNYYQFEKKNQSLFKAFCCHYLAEDFAVKTKNKNNKFMSNKNILKIVPVFTMV